MINLEYIANYFQCLTGNIQLIILGENHGDKIEWNCQDKLIDNIKPDCCLIEDQFRKENLEGKYKSIIFELCDISEEEKKIVQTDSCLC